MYIPEALKNKSAKFLDCELDCNSGQLLLASNPKKLEPLILQFLLLLIAHRGDVLTKQKVVNILWGDKKSSDEALRAMVKKTREALGDNARNPQYIKTIPTKGYLFIPHVELQSTLPKSIWTKYAKHLMGLGAVCIFCAFGIYWLLTNETPGSEDLPVVVLSKKELTRALFAKVNTHYYDNDLFNIATMADAALNVNKVVMHNIDENNRIEIAFSSAISEEIFPIGRINKILVMRNDYSQIFSVSVELTNIQADLIEYDTPWLANYSKIAVDNAGRHIIGLSNDTKTLALVEIENGEQQPSSALTVVNDDIQANYLGHEFLARVWPSPSNEYLAIALIQANQSRFFVFDSVDTQQVGSRFEVQGSIDDIVWDKQGQRFSFIDKEGSLSSFQFNANRLTTWNTGGSLEGELAADCGGSCFILATSDGEQSFSQVQNPFLNTQQSQPNPDFAFAQLASGSSHSRQELQPLYSASGLYFLARGENGLQLLLKTDSGKEETVYQFERGLRIDGLTISPSNQMLAGQLDKRPFIVDLVTKQFRYIQLSYPTVQELIFYNNETLSFYVQGLDLLNADSSFDERATNTIGDNKAQTNTGATYHYSLASGQVKLVYKGVRRLDDFSIDTATGTQENTAVQGRLLLDTNGKLKADYNQVLPTVELATIDELCKACWHRVGEYIYILVKEKSENEQDNGWRLDKKHLLDGSSESRKILFSDLTGEFSISDDASKIAFSRRQGLQTILTKVEGMQQIF